ncbi:MAG: hypothetical protein KC466_05040 [Myxococcales bacterium]|nr:hypothetical protein [Myxococcales bacterium]
MQSRVAVGALSSAVATRDRRRSLLTFCFVVGLGGPALCWVLALLGYQTPELRLDRFATAAVTLSVYAPLLAFYDNPGERRTLDQQLLHLAWLWFFSNTGYQVFWEMPWFLLKDTLRTGMITMSDTAYWPWWAYGVADTRYLSKNDLVLAISALDGSVALLEVAAIYLYVKGYRLLVAWLALILGSCMGWGQYYFYVGEIYKHFSGIEDGWYGFYIKYWLMGFPWLVFPIVANLGLIWYIAAIYKKRGVEEYLAGREPEFGASFAHETDMLMTTDERGARIEEWASPALVRWVLVLMFVWPFVFLGVDIARFYMK